MRNALGEDFIGTICEVFIDDVVVTGTTESEHFANLYKILKSMQVAQAVKLQVQHQRSDLITYLII